jgi:hypothetical protein
MSIELRSAIENDNAVINSNGMPEYIDNSDISDMAEDIADAVESPVASEPPTPTQPPPTEPGLISFDDIAV